MARPVTNTVEFFKSLVEEVVAEDPRNKNNLGKLLLCAMRRHPKDALLQIDAGTDKRDTLGEALDRSVRTAQALRAAGVGVGDVVVGMGRNHLDVAIPVYASLFVGAAFMGVDTLLNKDQIEKLLEKVNAKILFCDVANLDILPENLAAKGTKVVTFQKDPNISHQSFKEFYQNSKVEESIDDFQVPVLDTARASAALCTTSGTTGPPKIADVTHDNTTPMMGIVWTSGLADFPTQTRMLACLAPVYWYSAFVIHVQTALFMAPKVQTSAPLTPQHIYDIVNKYQPSWIAMTPALALVLLKQADAMRWDCFYTFAMTGSALADGLVDTLNDLIGRPAAVNGYGLTEASGRVFYGAEKTPGSLGVPLPITQIKLVDHQTGEEVQGTAPGELWIKGPSVCRGYYGDPEATREAFTADGWFKTGDIVHRNDAGHFYYVDRIKSMMNVAVDGVMYHISPVEIENEIKEVSGVLDVAVTAAKQSDDLARPMAVVVRKTGAAVTEHDIVRHVQERMPRSRHLTGGVRFVDALPLLAAGKLDRRKLAEMIQKL